MPYLCAYHWKQSRLHRQVKQEDLVLVFQFKEYFVLWEGEILRDGAFNVIKSVIAIL